MVAIRKRRRMQARPTLSWCAVLFLVTGCDYSTMQSTTYDPRTGANQTVTYSKYFETTHVIVPSAVGVHLVVDLEKTEVPGLYGLQQSLGALGPSDTESEGLITLYLFNLSDEAQRLSLVRGQVSGVRSDIPGLPQEVTIGPREQKRKLQIPIRIPVGSYSTDLYLKLVFSYRDAEIPVEIVAERQTFDELKRKYGPDGSGPDFSWK